MNIKYVSPSYKRAKGCLVLGFLSKIKVYVAPQEYDDYCKYNKEYQDRVVAVPDGVQGNGKSKCMNWMLDNLWDEDTDAIIMIDDDVSGIMKHIKNAKDEKISEEDFYELVENWVRLAKEWGCGMFAISPSSDPLVYDEFAPFRLHGYCDGQVTGWCMKNEIRYDEELTIKEDVDFALKNWQKYHKCLRIEKYYPKSKSFGDNEGGCNVFRSSEEEKRQFKIMQKKWGTDIIRPNRPTAKKASKIKGLGGAIKLRLPFSGT
jgi:hypothetical protein